MNKTYNKKMADWWAEFAHWCKEVAKDLGHWYNEEAERALNHARWYQKRA